MKPTIQPDDLQQAWQTAFHLRTCPDDTTLRMAEPDEHLRGHLSLCSICREKRAMPAEQINAWQGLFTKFAQQVHRAESAPQPGQIWVLKKTLARWGDDGYFYSPPNVLLLEETVDKHSFRVAQLYFDKRLMGEGDVWLGDKFGFAQGWNNYTLQQDVFDCWLGSATDSQLAKVVQAGAMADTQLEEHSILSFFRRLEEIVGAYTAKEAVSTLKAEESASVQLEPLELIPGLKLAVVDVNEFILSAAIDTIRVLRTTFRPTLVLRGGTHKSEGTKLTAEQKKLLQQHCLVIPTDINLAEDTLSVSLKWINGRPAIYPSLVVIFNGIDMSALANTNTKDDTITVCHNGFVSGQPPCSIRIRLNNSANTLYLDISND